MKLRPEEITSILRERIENFDTESNLAEVGASVAVLASATLTDSRMAGRNFGSGGALETVVGVYAAIAAAVARLRKTAPARLQSARRNASLSL